MNRPVTVSLVSLILLSILAFSAASASTCSLGGRTYTTVADFQEGVLEYVRTGSDPPLDNGHIELDSEVPPLPLPYIWVPNAQGTVSKVSTETGRELGRYWVAPHNGDPSRTTVDLYGNCWVGCRTAGTVVKIGLYEAGAWVDRNGDGVCQTSRDLNDDGDITGAELLPWGEDECVLHEIVLVLGWEGRYTPGTYTGPYDTNYYGVAPRGLAVDCNNNVWAGTWSTQKFYYIDGFTGQIVRTVDNSPYSSYGAVMDRNGVLWSVTGRSRGVVKIDPSTDPPTTSLVDVPCYGIGLDHENHLFVTGGALSRIDVVTGTVDWIKPSYGYGCGVVCTADNEVWVANYDNYTVARYNNEGDLVASIPTGNSPRGVAVDAAGKVWVCNLGDQYIHRIDPATNQIDLSKEIKNSGGHYSYSDMTGDTSRSITAGGTWTVVYDSAVSGAAWGEISWTSEPPGTAIRVTVRSSNDQTNWSTGEMAVNGGLLTTVPNGRYLKVTVSFTGAAVLYDLTVNRINAFITDKDLVVVPEGGTADFGVKLAFQPTSDVVASVAWAGGDPDISVQSGSTLVFTSSNWDTFQTVRLAAAEDLGTTHKAATIRVSAACMRDKDVRAIKEEDDIPPYVTEWDWQWNGRTQHPWDVCTDPWGYVYVAYPDANSVVKFTSDGGFIMQWGGYGTGEGQFDHPYGVGSDLSGNIYVADTYNDRVQKFTRDGVFLTKWYYGFNNPGGVRCDSSGYVYVADTYNHRVIKFDSSGQYAGGWGSEGADTGQFRYPTRVCSDGSGAVHVSDWGNNRIQKFTYGGTYVTKWGTLGSDNGQFDQPWGICSDPWDNIYVADSNNNRIQMFMSDSTFLATWGSYGYGPGQFDRPTGICSNLLGDIYVADTDNKRIQKFASVNFTVVINQAEDQPDPTGVSPIRFTVTFSRPTSDFGDGDVTLDGTAGATTADVTGSGANYTVTVSGTAQSGTIIASVEAGAAHDAGGNDNLASISADNTVIYDITPPSEVWVYDQGQYTNNPSVYFYWSGSYDEHSGIAGYDCQVGTTPGGSDVFNGNVGTDTWKTVTGSNGITYYCRVRAVDKVGNVSAWSASTDGITVDTVAPTPGAASSPQAVRCSPITVNYTAASDPIPGSGLAYVWLWYKKEADGYWQLVTYLQSSSSGWIDFYPYEGDGTYYFAMQASDNAGNYSSEPSGDGNTSTVYTSCDRLPIGKAKMWGDGNWVLLETATVTAVFGDCFYIEADNRSAGIEVLSYSHGLDIGARVDVEGSIYTHYYRELNCGERYVYVEPYAITPAGTGSVRPTAMNNKTLGGGDFHYDPTLGVGQRGVKDGFGTNNIGLLVRTFGRVTEIEEVLPFTDPTWFKIDDGSSVPLRVIVPSGVATPDLNSYAVVTGISSCEQIGEYLYRLLRVRSQDDIVVAQQ